MESLNNSKDGPISEALLWKLGTLGARKWYKIPEKNRPHAAGRESGFRLLSRNLKQGALPCGPLQGASCRCSWQDSCTLPKGWPKREWGGSWSVLYGLCLHLVSVIILFNSSLTNHTIWPNQVYSLGIQTKTERDGNGTNFPNSSFSTWIRSSFLCVPSAWIWLTDMVLVASPNSGSVIPISVLRKSQRRSMLQSITLTGWIWYQSSSPNLYQRPRS